MPDSRAEALKHHDKAFRLMQEERIAEAIEEYRRAVTLDPTLGVAYAELAVALARSDKKEEAQKMLQQAFKFSGHNPGVWVMAGTVHIILGDREEAIEDYKRAVQINPGQPDALDNLGRYSLSINNPLAALGHFTQLTEYHPDSLQGHIGSCLSLLAMDALSKAKPFCAKAHTLFPDLVPYLNQTAYNLYSSDHFNYALIHGRAAAYLAPDDIEILTNYGSNLNGVKKL